MVSTTDTEQLRPRLPPRRVWVRALLRSTLIATVLVVVYYALPLVGRLDGGAVGVLVIGLLVFVAAIVWQVRAILQADYPGLRTIEALGTAFPLFLLVFATAYLLLDNATAGAFSEPLSKTDALYFTITVLATVGFGDIAPRTELARIVTMIQMLANLLLLGLVARILVSALKEGRRRVAERDTAGGD